jgi:predicted Fe-Mo cluster-binding NifX family protein
MDEFIECRWGGKRQFAGRKKTCKNKVPFNRRINENILNILREYARNNDITETEALESAILLQSNIENKRKGEKMKVAMPSANGKLCGHFGHCEDFTFAEIDLEKKEIKNVETKVPEDGISCQSANWIAEQGVNVVFAGGMGGRPLEIFARNGVQVITGCPELEVKELLNAYMEQVLKTGENACGGEHHHCHGHGHHEGHCHH